MSVQFFTEFPLWYIFFCIAAGALYSFILYRKNNHLYSEVENKNLLWALTALRFLSVTIIAFLLLNPLLKYSSNSTEIPVVVLAMDNSESVVNSADSARYRKELNGLFGELQNKLGNQVKLQSYLFGNKPVISSSPNFKDKQSDFSSLFSEISNVYSGSNVGGMILVSDGIYNKGSNPSYLSKQIKFPIFTLGLGDTLTKKDLKIANIRSNSIAYLNNTFPAIIDIEADKCLGQSYNLSIFEGSSKVFETRLSAGSSSDFKSINVDLEASKPGVLHFTAVLSQLDGEVTWVNNRRDFFIEVIDARQKVLLAARSPHPDLSAIKQAIESNKNYQVSLDVTGNPTLEKSNDYDVVVLHQLPSANHHAIFIEGLKAKKIPLLFILGRQTNLSLFNNLNVGLRYNATGGGFNQTTGIMNPEFNLFENNESVKSNVPSFPPFAVPFGTFGYKDKSQIMVFQQIGSVNTEQPLICFNDEANNRYGFFTGEGFWRWRLLDFERNNNQNVTNDLICKSIQYLVARNDRRKLRVYPTENTFYENEPIIFNAEYYNQSYELVNKPELKMNLTNEKGKNFTFIFSRTDNAYKLDAGILPPGNYAYTVKVISGGNNESTSGKIIVKPLQLEYTDTKANHELLRQLSQNTGGKFLLLSQADQLADLILKMDSIKPVIYEQKDYRDLINQKWVFFLILLLISMEWFMRKRNGAY